MLGAAGLLRENARPPIGRRTVCSRVLGAVPVHARVVRDGNLMTGGGVTPGVDFALTLIAELAGQEVAKAIELNLEYAPAPPFGTGRPETAPAAAAQTVRKRIAPIVKERRKLAEAAARGSASAVEGTRPGYKSSRQFSRWRPQWAMKRPG